MKDVMVFFDPCDLSNFICDDPEFDLVESLTRRDRKIKELIKEVNEAEKNPGQGV